LQTRAVRDGDQWIVNGQKVWTSGAHIARYGILVARTDPTVPKHRGLTYFVIDMDQPGIEVRPIREITGRAIFNEVFLTDAVVPVENTIDAVGSGWGVALTTLANERTMLGAGSFGSSGGGMSITRPDVQRRVGDLARDADADGGAPRAGGVGALLRALRRTATARGDDPLHPPGVRHDPLAAGDRPLHRPSGEGGRGARRTTRPRGLDRQARRQPPAPLAPRDDVPGVRRRRDAVGRRRTARRGRMHDVGFSSYLISIGGGTDQIQRNIIGERVLGLPGEPRVDKDVAFDDLLVGTQRPPTG
jgi:hypothetical protein